MSRLHDWSYQVRAKKIRDAAYADPSTRCWRCGRTLAEVQAANPDRRIVWHAGHVVTGDRYSPLLAEDSLCNLRDAQLTSMHRRKGSSGGTQRF